MTLYGLKVFTFLNAFAKGVYEQKGNGEQNKRGNTTNDVLDVLRQRFAPLDLLFVGHGVPFVVFIRVITAFYHVPAKTYMHPLRVSMRTRFIALPLAALF